MATVTKVSKAFQDLYRPAAFCARFPDLVSQGTLRWQIYQAPRNGLAEAGAIIRCGRTIWISASRYRDWLFSHQVQPATAERGKR